MTGEPELLEQADDEAQKAIYDRLRAYNLDRFGPSGYKALQIVLRDDADAVTGGIVGETARGWLFIKLLFVPEEARGQGLAQRLLTMAETEAQRRGCTGAQIDTMNPQALKLYQKAGYEIAGRVPDMTGGISLTWLIKRLSAPTEP